MSEIPSRRHDKALFSFVLRGAMLAASILLSCMAVAALPSAIEVDRSLLRAETALIDEDYERAVTELEKLQQLTSQLPESYY